MSLLQAISYAKRNPIKSRGRSSISRTGSILTNGLRYFYGWNSYKSSRLQAEYAKKAGYPERVCTHAEVSAISQATKGKYLDLSEFTLYVARVLYDGTPALAKPCPVCQLCINDYGIQHVEYTK